MVASLVLVSSLLVCGLWRPLAASLALSGGPSYTVRSGAALSGAVSGGLWRSLAVSGGPTPRSAAVSDGLVPSIHRAFE